MAPRSIVIRTDNPRQAVEKIQEVLALKLLRLDQNNSKA